MTRVTNMSFGLKAEALDHNSDSENSDISSQKLPRGLPRGILFECTVCAKCCKDSGHHRRRIIFSEKEAGEISDLSGIPIEAFSRKSGRTDMYSRRMKKISGSCFFLKAEDNLCRIYEKRPLVCRFYPFELKPDGSWATAKKEECEGLGRGSVLPPDHFRRLLKRAKEVFY